MVKLVVADDEERVCRLIVALGNWEELGIKVVGTAANGIQKLKPAGIQINANIIMIKVTTTHSFPFTFLLRLPAIP